VDRAVAAAGCQAGISAEALARFGTGCRDAELLKLREKIFDPA
jgi:hypothetical protein